MKSPLPKEAYYKNAEIYRVMANPKRLEILNLLAIWEMSVDEIAEALRISKANVSQHLALLRQTRLVVVRRKGLNAFYKITDPRIVKPCHIFHDLLRKNLIQVSIPEIRPSVTL